MARSINIRIITAAILILLSLRTRPISSNDDDEYYILDNPITSTTTSLRSRSLFLTDRIRKGMRCSAGTSKNNNNVCDGVLANNGTSLLYCCKNHCRNVARDDNNCGRCGNKCGFGKSCCNGACVSLAYNAHHCGQCNRRCSPTQNCQYGSCGYA